MNNPTQAPSKKLSPADIVSRLRSVANLGEYVTPQLARAAADAIEELTAHEPPAVLDLPEPHYNRADNIMEMSPKDWSKVRIVFGHLRQRLQRASQPPSPAQQLYKYVGECLKSDMTPERWKVFRQFRRFFVEPEVTGPNEAASPSTKPVGCVKCGSTPLATERGRCEECGAYQSSLGE